MTTARGVRQVNENIIQEGRALIITDNEVATWPQTKPYEFQLLPDGSLYINPETGVMKIKIEGETDWIPAGIKNDGTIVISRDTALEENLITITKNNVGDGTFKYSVLYPGVTTAQNRTKAKTQEGYYVFEVENGMYFPGRHHLSIIKNGTTEYSVIGNDIEEVDGKQFIFKRALSNGDKLLVKYIKWIKLGSPYPRIFMQTSAPADAQIGDFWLDIDGSFDNHTDIVEPILNYKTSTGWIRLYNTLLSKVLRKDRYLSEFNTPAAQNNVVTNLDLDNRYDNRFNPRFLHVANQLSEFNTQAKRNAAIANLALDSRYLRIDADQDLTQEQKDRVAETIGGDDRYLNQNANLGDIQDAAAARTNIGCTEILPSTVTTLWDEN